MPTVLYSFRKTDKGIMFHGFMAPNGNVAEEMEQEHAAVCPVFGPALEAGKTIEIEVEEDELPTFDADSLTDYLQASDVDEEDEEEPEPEER